MIVGGITIIYVLFSDVVDGVTESEIINPPVLLAFITLFSAGGYLLEEMTSWNSYLIAGFSLVSALILVTILNVFVLIPIKNAEQSMAYTDQSLIGRQGKVVVPIPSDGFGQIIIESKTALITKAAVSFDNKNIDIHTNVIVVEIKPGSLIVKASDITKLEE